MKAVEALLEGESGKALLVVGAPCVGKSTLARDALMAGLRRHVLVAARILRQG